MEKLEKKVRFVEEPSTIPDKHQWLPVHTKTVTKEGAQAGVSSAKACVKEKPLKQSNTKLRRDKESARSQKAAKVKAEWRRVWVNESSESCYSSTDKSSEEEQVRQPIIITMNDEVLVMKDTGKGMPQNKGKASKMKWIPKPVDDLSAN